MKVNGTLMIMNGSPTYNDSVALSLGSMVDLYMSESRYAVDADLDDESRALWENRSEMFDPTC